MPQRSNEFQHLVEIVHRLYAPVGAKITPSAMVKPKSGGPAREIDVLVEYEMELYSVKIAIEARDLSRPLDVIAVEEYIGKYNSSGGIVVNKVIIVAKSFSKTARERATLLGFSLQTLNELEQSGATPYFAGPENNGGFAVGKRLGQRVELHLVDKRGKRLPIHSVITPRTSKTTLGTAIMWARRALDYSIGSLANDQFEKHAGQLVHVVINLHFRDHKARVNRDSYNLGKLIFDFGERMNIPAPTVREAFELTGEDGKTKTIIREIAHGQGSTLSFTYEDPKEASRPGKFYFDIQPQPGEPSTRKKIVVDMAM